MEQVNVTLTETIKLLLDDKKFSTLRDILITMKPFDIAAVFENLQDEKMPILFRILPKELAAETFVEMDDETQEFLIHGFSWQMTNGGRISSKAAQTLLQDITEINKHEHSLRDGDSTMLFRKLLEP